MFPVELELSEIPQWEECLLRVKLHFRQQLATIGSRKCFLESLTCHLINPSLSCMHAYTHSHIQTETRNDTTQIRNRESDLDNLLRNSV